VVRAAYKGGGEKNERVQFDPTKGALKNLVVSRPDWTILACQKLTAMSQYTFWALLSLLLVSVAGSRLQDVSNLCILQHKSHSNATLAISKWLLKEVTGRQSDNVRWKSSHECSNQPTLQLHLIPASDQGLGRQKYPCGTVLTLNSYVLSIANGVVEITANDENGLRQGAGRLLRELSMPGRHGDMYSPVRSSQVHMPASLCVAPKARFPVRGHQIPCTHHPVQFRTGPEFLQFAQDLAAFGTTQLELAHIENLPASQATEGDALSQFSSLTAEAGLRVSLWWPLQLSTDPVYQDPASVFKNMPRLDSVFLPGGDGGSVSWPGFELTAQLARASHPEAKIYVSAQELSSTEMPWFWANASIAYADGNGYLSGLVYGPHTRDSLTDFIHSAQTEVSPAVPVRDYPDITHTLSCQFAFSGWHSAWSLTHDRQPVMPMPKFFASIMEQRANGSYAPNLIGFGAYSEGLGDDLNKFMWSAMGADQEVTMEMAVKQYARYFFGSEHAEQWEQVLYGLEENWAGVPGTSNKAIGKTLQLLQFITGHNEETAATWTSTDWRVLMYLKRGYYDAYIRARYIHEVEENENKAYELLTLARDLKMDSLDALTAATAALNRVDTSPTHAFWRTSCDQMFTMINNTLGAEVLGNQDTSLNMGTIDHAISDSAYLLTQFANITKLSTVTQRVAAISALLRYPGDDGYFDVLGGDACYSPYFSNTGKNRAPHLLPGLGRVADPEFYYSPLVIGPSSDNFDVDVKMEWNCAAMSFFDANAVSLRYEQLKVPAAGQMYVARVVFSAEPEARRRRLTFPAARDNLSYMRLVANGETVVWPPLDNSAAHPGYSYAPTPTQVTEIAIPLSSTANGTLTLTCEQLPGVSGNGRTCQIISVWVGVVDHM